MKTDFFLTLIFSLILSSCDQPSKQCSKMQCPAGTAFETLERSLKNAVSSRDADSIDPRSRVFAQIRDFDIVPFFILCDEIDREKVFQTLVDACKKLGDVHVTKAEPLIESLFNDPPMDVNGILSISSGFQFSAKLVMSSTVKMVPNGCETSCAVWETTSYADQVCQVVEDIMKQFGEVYREANPDPSTKPIFKIRNVITSF